MVSELLQKYLWLIQVFMRAGYRGLTLEEISDRWEVRWGEKYVRRSFFNHRNIIYEIFGIRISCRRSDNCYYLDAESMDQDSNSSFRWMLDSVTMNSLAELRDGQLKGRITLESVPAGRDNLSTIAGAMQDNVKLKLAYLKYTSKESSNYTIRPYALKENARRWYLVGYCEERSQVRVYALDRIVSLEVTGARFKMPVNFDVDRLFAGCFGVYLPDEGARCVRIVFRMTEQEAKYVADLPIHESQKEIERKDGFVTYEIMVYPNKNLMMEFLSRGESLEILEPAEIRDQIKEEIKKTIQLYE